VAGDDLGDVRRQPVQDGIGDEEPPEVMGSEVKRAAGRVGQAGAGERLTPEELEAVGDVEDD
jgi:hypothetical protein